MAWQRRSNFHFEKNLLAKLMERYHQIMKDFKKHCSEKRDWHTALKDQLEWKKEATLLNLKLVGKTWKQRGERKIFRITRHWHLWAKYYFLYAVCGTGDDIHWRKDVNQASLPVACQSVKYYCGSTLPKVNVMYIYISHQRTIDIDIHFHECWTSHIGEQMKFPQL